MGCPRFVITYSAADVTPFTTPLSPGSHYGDLVHDSQSDYTHHEVLYIPLPPDWLGGYTSILSHQDCLKA